MGRSITSTILLQNLGVLPKYTENPVVAVKNQVQRSLLFPLFTGVLGISRDYFAFSHCFSMKCAVFPVENSKLKGTVLSTGNFFK